MSELIRLLSQPQSISFLILLTLYFVWVLRVVISKRWELERINSNLMKWRDLDPTLLVNSTKESVLAQVAVGDRIIRNRLQLIVNYALAGIPYTQDVLSSSEEEAFDLNEIMGDLNIFPLLGLGGTTLGLILALSGLPESHEIDLPTFMESMIPNMTLAFSSTLFSIMYLIITYLVFFRPLHKYKEHLGCFVTHSYGLTPCLIDGFI